MYLLNLYVMFTFVEMRCNTFRTGSESEGQLCAAPTVPTRDLCRWQALPTWQQMGIVCRLPCKARRTLTTGEALCQPHQVMNACLRRSKILDA